MLGSWDADRLCWDARMLGSLNAVYQLQACSTLDPLDSLPCKLTLSNPGITLVHPGTLILVSHPPMPLPKVYLGKSPAHPPPDRSG